MDPFFSNLLIFTLGKLIADPVTEIVSSYFKREQAELQYKAQLELEKLRGEANIALLERKSREAEKMFKLVKEKELELHRLQFEHQKEIIEHTVKNDLEKKDWELALKDFPVKLRPTQLLRAPDSLLLIVKHKTQNNKILDGEDTSINESRRVSIDHRLSQFLQNGYGLGQTHPIMFLQGSWIDPAQSGQTATLALHSYLKSRPTVFIEYEIIETEVILNIAYWRANEEKDHFSTFASFPIFVSEEFLSENADIAENHGVDIIFQHRLHSLQTLAIGIIADIYYMINGNAMPLLPARIPDIADIDEDPYIIEAANKVFTGYLYVLSEMKKLTPHRAAEISLDISEKLKRMSNLEPAKEFYDFSLKTFIEVRGVPFDDNTDLLDQAAEVHFDYDEAFFAKAKSIRRVFLEENIEERPQKSINYLSYSTSFEDRLRMAKDALNNILQSANNLRSSSPEDLDVFLKDFSIDGLLNSIQKSLKDLENPVFRIVPVGVTNSGKSTLTGAIIGRNLLPRGSGEVSMSVLRFIHRPSGLLVREIWSPVNENDEETVIETSYDGELGSRDEEVAKYLKSKMTEYAANGFVQGSPFPRFEIETPLLPGVWREMFALPENVSFEFADVPGYNSTDNNDRNLAIIQQEIGGNFCVFILDWNTANTDKDENLLAVIRETLDVTGADEESIIFILNKFDDRDDSDSADDVTRRLTQFRKALRKKLKLDFEPEVLTMSGRLWFYGQVGWGPSSPQEAPSATSEMRDRMLKSLLKDEAKIIHQIEEGDERYEWTYEKLIKQRGKELSLEDYHYLLNEIVYSESGAKAFCQTISEKIRQRCASLVIRPLVNNVLRQSQTFLAAVNKRHKDAQIQSRDEITDEIKLIRKCIKDLKESVSTKASEIEDIALNVIPKLGGESLMGEYDKAYEKYGENLRAFTEITKNLKTDLADNVAKPLRNFKQDAPIPKQWLDVLQKKSAESLYQAAKNYFTLTAGRYKMINSQQMEFSSQPSVTSTNYIIRCEEAYGALIKQIEKAMNERCRFELQKCLSRVAAESQGILDTFYETIKEKANEIVKDIDLINALLAGIQPELIIETLMDISMKGKKKSERKAEQRQTLVTETAVVKTVVRATADSFRSIWRRLTYDTRTDDLFKTITKNVYRNREHTVSRLPNQEGMQNQVNEMFESYTNELRENLMAWLTKLLKDYALSVTETSQLLSDSLSSALEQQRAKSETQRLDEIERWKTLTPILRQGTSSVRSLQISIEYG
jgi:hypothetical protein